MRDCPSAAHGTPRDPYGCWERSNREAARIELAVRADRARRAPAAVFVFAVRIDGGSDAVLTLHDTYEGAVSSLLREGARLYRARFGYVPSDLSPASAAALADLPTVVAHRISQAEDRLLGGGWVARIDELPLELGSSAAVSA